jgi:hypothetical protein
MFILQGKLISLPQLIFPQLLDQGLFLVSLVIPRDFDIPLVRTFPRLLVVKFHALSVASCHPCLDLAMLSRNPSLTNGKLTLRHFIVIETSSRSLPFIPPLLVLSHTSRPDAIHGAIEDVALRAAHRIH